MRSELWAGVEVEGFRFVTSLEMHVAGTGGTTASFLQGSQRKLV